MDTRDEAFPVVFAAKNMSDEIRSLSSSGGMFYALAQYAIEHDGVVYGCAFDEDFRVRHIRCESLEECRRCMGSKYSQSDISAVMAMIQKDMEDGRFVLFTGTPCQVDMVRTLFDDNNLFAVDLVCHGVPSNALFREHIEFLQTELGSEIVSYEHRPKTLGWGHCERLSTKDGKAHQNTRLSESWKRFFYDNRMLRPSCYECPYTSTKRRSDLTIADFWRISRTPHASLSDGLGVSLVLANTEAGLDVFGKLDVVSEKASIEEALPGNPMLSRSSVYQGNRDELWQSLYSMDYASLLRKYGFWQSLPSYFGSKLRSLARRIIRK